MRQGIFPRFGGEVLIYLSGSRLSAIIVMSSTVTGCFAAAIPTVIADADAVVVTRPRLPNARGWLLPDILDEETFARAASKTGDASL